MGDNRNLIIAIAISMAILLVYQLFVIEPAAREQREAAAARAAAAPAASGAAPDAPPAALPAAADPEARARQRAEALAQDARIAVRTPSLQGSVNLRGGVLDDLTLQRYRLELPSRQTPEPGPVPLLHPSTAQNGYTALVGWTADAEAGLTGLPDARTEWRQVGGGDLTPDTPVTLSYRSPEGLLFLRRISVDQNYLFSIVDEVRNEGAAEVALQSFGRIRRNGVPEDLADFMILHEGMIGVLDNRLIQRKYKRMDRDGATAAASVGGWVGITDKYWLTALAPAPTTPIQGEFRVVGREAGAARYDATFIANPITIAPGQAIEVTTHLFAGAKRVNVLREYQKTLGIVRLDNAVDWGNFWFFTRPFFFVLDFFYKLTGNFGVAILMLTVVIKGIFFPLANASFKSMARMKAVAPKMQEIRERFAADPQRQQKELMQLYQREKVNPVAGCLPILVQIPVFYALYKTLFVTIEMRHAPFFGWIRDLSAPDPTNIWNLFGLLPYDPSGLPLIGGVLALGVWPIVMGFTMWAVQSLNPPPPDPIQQKIFAFMPVIFTFMLAPFAAGLVIYWTWNNMLTFAQQYAIMRGQGVDTPLGTFIARRLGRKPPAPSGSKA